jgi:hypothetical protein
MKRKMTLMPLFRDKDSVPLQPLKEIELFFTLAPLVAIRIHMPYETVDTLLVLDTDLPIGDLAFIRGVPLLCPDIPYRVVLCKEKAPPKRFYFKQLGYAFGYKNIVDVRDEEGDPLIPDISIRFFHSNYQLLINRSPFTVKVLTEEGEDGDEATEGEVAYAKKPTPITMDALECSFCVVGNLFINHNETLSSNGTFS